MTFQKFMHKYTRIIFGAIVGLVAISLVLTFAPGSRGSHDKENLAGELADGTKIPMADYNKFLVWALAFHKSEDFHREIDLRTVRTQQDWSALLDRPSREHREAAAWEMLLVLRKADEMGVTSTEQEGAAAVNEILEKFVQRNPDTKMSGEEYQRHVQTQFELSTVEFEKFARELVRYRKYLAFLGYGESGGFPEPTSGVFEFPSAEDATVKAPRPQRARLVYAIFDPEEFENLTDPVSPRQIEDEVDHSPMVSKARAQIDFIIADYDRYNELPEIQAKKPTEKDLRDWYEKNKNAFVISEAPHDHDHDAEIEPPKPPQEKKYKPFEEVKEEIRKRLMRDMTSTYAAEDIKRVATEVRTKLAKATSKDDERALGKALDFAGMATAAKLRYGASPAIADSPEDKERLEKEIGKLDIEERKILEMLFRENAPEGTVVCVPQEKTDKGRLIYRVRQRWEPKPRELDDDVRRVVERSCEAEARRHKAAKVAEEFGKRLKAGMTLGGALAEWTAKGVHPSVHSTSYFDVAPGHIFFRGFERELQEFLFGEGQQLQAEGILFQRDLHQFAAHSQRGATSVGTVEIENKGDQAYAVYLEDKAEKPSKDSMDDLLKTRKDPRQRSMAPRKEFVDGLVKSLKQNYVKK